MAQNITLMGASYSAVPAVTLPKTGGGTASFTDVTDTTAIASDVASGKYFHLATGERVQGTASGDGATFATKTITQNGTYSASSDNADGYSSVTVAIPIVTYHTSSSAPTSSQGSDGDLWLVTA